MDKRPPQHLGVVAIEKGDFGSPSTKVANFTYFLIYLFYSYIFKVQVKVVQCNIEDIQSTKKKGITFMKNIVYQKMLIKYSLRQFIFNLFCKEKPKIRLPSDPPQPTPSLTVTTLL